MRGSPITIQCFIQARLFTEFAWYDLLCVQKRWRRPAVFAAFFVAIAALAFSRVGRSEGAALLGGVLLAVGLGLPLVYFLGFRQSVRRQSRRFTGGESAYTVTLDERGVSVVKGAQNAHWDWDGVHAVHRLRRCICLYTDPRHALLLPSADNADAVAAAWALMTARLAPQRINDRLRGA